LSRTQKGSGKLVSLIFLLGWLTGVVVEDGDLSSVDASRRLQMAKSWHSNQPEVTEADQRVFGVRGPDGVSRAWYGPGQAIVMLPAEAASSWVTQKMGWQDALAERFQHAMVVYSTFPVVAGLGCVAVFLMLAAAGFSERASLFGAWGMLYGSSFLNYTQVNQENSLMILCFAASLWAGLRISQGEGWKFGIALGAAAGFSALIRLTTLAETAAAFGILLLLIWRQSAGFKQSRQGLISAFGVFGLFLFLERLYHHHRFGDWTSTYFKLFKEQWPDLDATGNFWRGFQGFMFSSNESVWLFDPLALAGLILVFGAVLRKKASIWAPTVLLAAGSLGVLIVYVLFYSPVSFWEGASAWGSRYTTTPMQILSALAAALIWQSWLDLKKGARITLISVVSLTVFLQLLSILFWHNLEEIQLKVRPEAWGVIGQRGVNAAAKLTGNFQAWGLDLPRVSERLQTWNFAPFLSQKHLPPGLSSLFTAGWWLLVGALVGVNFYIWKKYLLGQDTKRG
jgi:hypothetical protein